MLEQPLPREPRVGSRDSRLDGNLLSSQFLQFLALVLGIAGLTTVLFLYVLPNSQINAARLRIVELKSQKLALDRQNAEMLKEISIYTDLRLVEARARQLGMGPAKDVLYVKSMVPVDGIAADPRASVDPPAAEVNAAAKSPGQILEDLRQGSIRMRAELDELVDRVQLNLMPR